MATYAGNQTAAYKQQSILTAPPGRLVVMLYDGCLRFLFQSAYAMREGDRAQSQDRMRRAEAIIDELTVHARPRAWRRGREPPAGHLRLLPPAPDRGAARAGPEQDRRGLRAAQRAARGLGRDRRRHDAPRGAPWAELVALAERERDLVRDGRWDELPAASAHRLSASEALGPPPAAAPAASRAPLRARSVRSTPACPRAAPSRSRSSATWNRGAAAMRGYAGGSAARRRLRRRPRLSAAVARRPPSSGLDPKGLQRARR